MIVFVSTSRILTNKNLEGWHCHIHIVYFTLSNDSFSRDTSLTILYCSHSKEKILSRKERKKLGNRIRDLVIFIRKLAFSVS